MGVKRISSARNMASATRSIEGHLTDVGVVADNITSVILVANLDINDLTTQIQQLIDFTNINVQTLPSGSNASWDPITSVLSIPAGDKGIQGDKGVDGNGIKSIGLFRSLGQTKTYRVTFDDNSKFDFDVVDGTNGAKGDTGQSAYEVWISAGNSGSVDQFLEAIRGKQGETGPRGLPFTYDDFTQDQLNSLRGPQGVKGDDGDRGPKGDRGQQGVPGEAGYTPILSLRLEGSDLVLDTIGYTETSDEIEWGTLA